MSKLDDYLQEAQAAMEQFERTDDIALLSIDLLNNILAHPDFSSLPKQLQHTAVACAGAKTLERFFRLQEESDLNRAIDLLQQAIALADLRQAPPAIEFNRLATAFHYRFSQTNDPRDLSQAIEFWRHAVAVVPFDPINKGIWLSNLSIGLRAHYLHYHDEEAVDEAVKCCREAIELVGPNVLARQEIIISLAEGLALRHTYAKAQADIDEAISLYREALSAAPAGSRDLGRLLNNLGHSLYNRYKETESARDLDESIHAGTQAWEVSKDDLNVHGNVVGNLLYAYRDRYLLTGNIDDLEHSLSCALQLLELESPNAEDRAKRIQTLAQLLRLLYDKTADRQDLEWSLQCYSEAIRLLPQSSTSFPNWLIELSDVLRRRHLLTNDGDDLEAAVHCSQRALQHSPAGSVNYARALTALGAGLGDRYLQTGAIEDLNEAIDSFREALALVVDKDATIAAPSASNLSNCLRLHYGRTGDISDLTWAIDVGRQSLVLSNPHSPGRAMFASNLGNSLREYYAHTEDRSHLFEAIKLFQEALESPTCAVTDRPMFLTNLGVALLASYDVTEQNADLDRAIECCKQAVSLTPKSSGDEPIRLSNLGVILFRRYEISKALPDLQEAIRSLERAFHATPENTPLRSLRLGNLAGSLATLYSHTGDENVFERAAGLWSKACEEGAKVDPANVLRVSQTWGDFELQRKNWTQAIEAFSYGTEAIEQLYKAQMLRPNKEAWLQDAQKLALNAAHAHARGGDLIAAVQQLEGGRARLLADSIDLARIELEQLPHIGYSELYERYKSATTQIKELEKQLSQEDQRSNRDLKAEWLASRAVLDAAIADIQQVPGYEDFFTLPGFDLIQNTLTRPDKNGAQSGVGIYLTVSMFGGMALIVHAGGIEPVWLNLIETDLFQLLFGKRQTDGYLATLLLGAQVTVELDQVLAFIEERIYQPVAAALSRLNVSASSNQNISSVILIPSFLLSVFPLHAPFYLNKDRLLPDNLSVSYSPSARALRYCQSNLHAYTATALVPTMLAVGNPLPVPEGFQSLPYARVEVEQCAQFFPDHAQCLVEDQATRSAVLSRIDEASYLQFSCHGHFAVREPLSAGIVLSNGERLSVADLLHMRGLNSSRLAVLSACKTALTDFIRVPEEAVGLPSSFLQIGVPGVIGTLWPVNDFSTALLMTKFYEYHLLGDPAQGSNEPMTPALALRRAQLWLRDLSRSEVETALDTLRKGSSEQRAVARHASVEGAFKTNDQQPFSEPFYWAPFVLYGL